MFQPNTFTKFTVHIVPISSKGSWIQSRNMLFNLHMRKRKKAKGQYNVSDHIHHWKVKRGSGYFFKLYEHRVSDQKGMYIGRQSWKHCVMKRQGQLICNVMWCHVNRQQVMVMRGYSSVGWRRFQIWFILLWWIRYLVMCVLTRYKGIL